VCMDGAVVMLVSLPQRVHSAGQRAQQSRGSKTQLLASALPKPLRCRPPRQRCVRTPSCMYVCSLHTRRCKLTLCLDSLLLAGKQAQTSKDSRRSCPRRGKLRRREYSRTDCCQLMVRTAGAP